MSKITRIAYNSSGWLRPTGEARREEAAGTYNSDNGFGQKISEPSISYQFKCQNYPTMALALQTTSFIDPRVMAT